MGIEEDKQRLKSFLADLTAVLGEVVHSRPSALPAHLTTPTKDAWPLFVRAVDQMRADLENFSTIDEDLRQAGLTDELLAMKLAGFQGALKRYRSKPGLVETALRKVFGWRRLRRVLGWANILLGSLASVIPAGEIVKEYKEAVEQGLDDAEGP